MHDLDMKPQSSRRITQRSLSFILGFFVRVFSVRIMVVLKALFHTMLHLTTTPGK